MRRFGEFMDARVTSHPTIKRWDGAARTCEDWDHLRRDPELWFRTGDCFVHLYGKGESRRGPSFKVPFSSLIEAKCYPLIERFIVWEDTPTPTRPELAQWTPRNASQRIELYIPAPSDYDRSQAYQYHVATRNFFAWVFRRSMVGESLGSAVVALLHSMHQFRSDVDDNVADMMEYFDEEGYLDMANQPNHALAMLYLAELFQMSELYTKAFVHCVGMSEQLVSSTEYEFITPESLNVIRRARTEMETKLAQCSSMLKTFLDEELSEAHLSVGDGARAHLERFRSFLLSFYTTKLGYYPPRDDFYDTNLLWSMREDFEALYDLLVDDRYTSAQTIPSYGGICAIQLVHSFDMRHDYTTLKHPMPRIPQLSETPRRLSWLPGRDRMRSDRRATAHASLVKASNIMKPGVAQNALVRAYRRFEEEAMIFPNKVDKQEKVSIADARKVRWIMVYGVYQVLLSATEIPVGVQQDIEEANYSLSVSTEHIPPWKTTHDMESMLRRQTQLFTKDSHFMLFDDSKIEESPTGIEIKPDIDYFALTHKEPPPAMKRPSSVLVLPERRASLPSRSNSLSRALSRSSTLRRSMRVFKTKTAPSSPPQTSSGQARPAYHEIVVHGYGNGTNDVNFAMKEKYIDKATWPERSDSDASKTSGSTPISMATTEGTVESQFSGTTPISFYAEDLLPEPAPERKKSTRQRGREVVSMITRSVSGRSSKRRPLSAMFPDMADVPDVPDIPKQHTDTYEDAVDQQSPPPQRTNSFILRHPLPPLPRSLTLTRSSLVLPDLRRKTLPNRRMSMPVKAVEQRQRKRAMTADEYEEPYIMAEDNYWRNMQTFMNPDATPREVLDHDGMPAWEQYADLGGLTDLSQSKRPLTTK